MRSPLAKGFRTLHLGTLTASCSCRGPNDASIPRKSSTKRNNRWRQWLPFNNYKRLQKFTQRQCARVVNGYDSNHRYHMASAAQVRVLSLSVQSFFLLGLRASQLRLFLLSSWGSKGRWFGCIFFFRRVCQAVLNWRSMATSGLGLLSH
ncbi:hypothetical protein EJ06DRAFT_65223 [Trichodelitschia bisporula]|uniref:Uncharacterized protein n=1 Tax=Trichodelitschia bisporula TaxID=703511 RepID=A0A6G1HT39_9PEZI|nr:hypothetical protein EJ06DRAFT_65223 [Trichodelitschia bisporula]